MSASLGSSRSRFVLVLALLAVSGFAAIASGQFGTVKSEPRRLEFMQQEVQAGSITQSLNDFDKQGWEIFQVIPVWQVKNENAETLLVPRTYEVFGRRPIGAK